MGSGLEGNHSLKHGPLRSRSRGKQCWSVQIAQESLPRYTAHSAASRHLTTWRPRACHVEPDTPSCRSSRRELERDARGLVIKLLKHGPLRSRSQKQSGPFVKSRPSRPVPRRCLNVNRPESRRRVLEPRQLDDHWVHDYSDDGLKKQTFTSPNSSCCPGSSASSNEVPLRTMCAASSEMHKDARSAAKRSVGHQPTTMRATRRPKSKRTCSQPQGRLRPGMRGVVTFNKAHKLD